MSMRYRLRIPDEFLTKKFTQTKITFFMGNVKSNNIVIISPLLKLYDRNKEIINTYSVRPICSYQNYEQYSRTFTITEDDLNNTSYYQIHLLLDGLNNETGLKFNNLMLNEGEWQEYIEPSSMMEESPIFFNNNFYALMYDKSDTYLQIIKPNYDSITTKKIPASKETIIAPHIGDECMEDSPANIGLEYMNMSDQSIDVLR